MLDNISINAQITTWTKTPSAGRAVTALELDADVALELDADTALELEVDARETISLSIK